MPEQAGIACVDRVEVSEQDSTGQQRNARGLRRCPSRLIPPLCLD